MNLNLGIVAILITLFIIIGAVITRRCVECMIVGSMVAAIFFIRLQFSYWLERIPAEYVG